MADIDDSALVRHSGRVDGLRFTLGLCLCYTLLISILRGYIRYAVYVADDAIVLLSTILALAFFGCSFASASAGLGRPLDVLDLQQPLIDHLNKMALVTNITWITALCMSKIAIVAMLLRTTQTKSHRTVQYGVGVVIAAQCLASVILYTANCSHPRNLSWDMKSGLEGCPREATRWLALTIFDVITEALLLFLPIQLVWGLKMDGRNRLTVVVAFWLRMPTIIFSVLRYRATHKLTTSVDISLTGATVVIWQAIQLFYSLAAVTIAALKRFTETLNTGFGHGELMRVHGSSQGYKLSDRSASQKGSKTSKANSHRPDDFNVTIDSMELESYQDELPPPRKGSINAYQRAMELRQETLNKAAQSSSRQEPPILECSLTNDGGLEDSVTGQEVQHLVRKNQGSHTQLSQP